MDDDPLESSCLRYPYSFDHSTGRSHFNRTGNLLNLMRRNLVIRYFLIFLLLFFSTSLHAQTDLDHAYLGVHTSRLDNGLSYQLGLPKGVHLQVDQVASGSPAEQAGIRLYDNLLRFDDQLLINPIN